MYEREAIRHAGPEKKVTGCWVIMSWQRDTLRSTLSLALRVLSLSATIAAWGPACGAWCRDQGYMVISIECSQRLARSATGVTGDLNGSGR